MQRVLSLRWQSMGYHSITVSTGEGTSLCHKHQLIYTTMAGPSILARTTHILKLCGHKPLSKTCFFRIMEAASDSLWGQLWRRSSTVQSSLLYKATAINRGHKCPRNSPTLSSWQSLSAGIPGQTQLFSCTWGAVGCCELALPSMEHTLTGDGSCPRPRMTISGWQHEAAQPKQPQHRRWKDPESLPEASVKSLLPIHIPSPPPQQVSSAVQLLQIYIRAGDMRNRAEALTATFFSSSFLL